MTTSTNPSHIVPKAIEPHSAAEVGLTYTDQKFALPYIELRFRCPCANCVDEMTGKRTLKRESLDPKVRITDVEVVGRYALKIRWSDQHSTGIHRFEDIRELCEKSGKKV